MSHRQRCVRPELWQHPAFLKLLRPERLLYLELVSLADDYGRLQATPVAVWRARYVDDEDHGLPAVTRADVARMLDRVEEVGLLRRHQIAGDTVGYLVGWSDAGHPAYQYISNKGKSRLPPDPTEAVRRPSAEPTEAVRRPSAEPAEGIRTDQDQDSDQDSEEDSEDLSPRAREARPVVEAEPEPEAPSAAPVPRTPAPPYVDGPMALNPRAARRLGVGGGGERPLSSEPDYMAVFSVLQSYRDHHPHTYRLPATAAEPEVQAIRARLEAYSVKDLIRAINAAHSRPWHRGANASGQTYLRLTTMLGSNQVVAELLELAATPPEVIEERSHARPQRSAPQSRAAQAAQRAQHLAREESGGGSGGT